MSRAHRPPFPAVLATGWCLPGVAICAICAQTVRLVVSGTAHSQQGLFGL
ncbi:hypothetical protein LJR066_000421 [Acidovorax sp. LjRoot66]